jgi:hypothetical protein
MATQKEYNIDRRNSPLKSSTQYSKVNPLLNSPAPPILYRNEYPKDNPRGNRIREMNETMMSFLVISKFSVKTLVLFDFKSIKKSSLKGDAEFYEAEGVSQGQGCWNLAINSMALTPIARLHIRSVRHFPKGKTFILSIFLNNNYSKVRQIRKPTSVLRSS